MELQDILTKRPFTRLLPHYGEPAIISDNDYRAINARDTARHYEQRHQIDFMRQLDPASHIIMSEEYYPDRVTYDEKTDQWRKEKVFRATFPFQQIILTQQLVHLCGNDIHLELTSDTTTDRQKELLLAFRRGWLETNMETAFYELAKSVKSTADGATVLYMDGGKLRWRTLSFALGDILYPHYDANGDLAVFARQYNAYDADGGITTTFVEVWDETFMYVYRRDEDGLSATMNVVKGWFGIDGFKLISKRPHGFREVPIVYQREDSGPCWNGSQDSIDKYELAVSHLCQNNMAYAFPIMVLKGDEVELAADIYGAVKAITTGKDDDASYMMPTGNSDLFRLQLDTLLKNIFQGSFAVMTPEIKSGDLPGVAIKLIYSPSIDKAMDDAKVYDGCIDKLARLFAWGYGMQIEKPTQLSNLGVYAWIEPYVHQNQAELINNLCMLVNANLLSRNTACQLTGYAENNEFDKIMREWKEEQAADLLTDLGNNTSINADTITTRNQSSEGTA